jgi:hypothetical protein
MAVPRTPTEVVADVRARVVRAIDALADGDLDFCVQLLDDLLVDLEEIERRLGWS